MWIPKVSVLTIEYIKAVNNFFLNEKMDRQKAKNKNLPAHTI